MTYNFQIAVFAEADEVDGFGWIDYRNGKCTIAAGTRKLFIKQPDNGAFWRRIQVASDDKR